SLGSIAINYKRSSGSIEQKKVAHVFGVKNADKLFPVYTSIGRDHVINYIKTFIIYQGVESIFTLSVV
ncbi:MAG: hypothetical protein WCE88_08450, partial [Burkholderiales bacterium]